MPHQLPKRVNIIWVGTQQPMSTEKLDVIKKWSEKFRDHPDFKVVLWVDVKSSNKENLEEIKDCYGQKGLKADNVEFVDISTLDTLSEESRLAYSCARHEIDRMEANFGNASDILRYIILSNFGGAYFDIDIEPHDIESFVRIFHDYEEPALFVGTDSQTPYISEEIKIHCHIIAEMFKLYLEMLKYPDFLETWRSQFDLKIKSLIQQAVLHSSHAANHPGTPAITENILAVIESKKSDYLRNPMEFYRFLAEKCSNDMFIATVGNPVMLDILRRVINNYTTKLRSVNNKTPGKLLSPENQRKVAVKFCYSGWNKMLRAIPITGPDAVREAIFNHAKYGSSAIRTIRGGEGDFVNTYPAALTWLRSFTKNCQSPSELIQSCVNDLVFEASHLGIVRIEDYIFLLKRSLQNQGFSDASEYIRLFLIALDKKLESEGISGFILQNAYADFGKDINASAYEAILTFTTNHADIKPADIDIIINCLFMEDDFAQGSIQADYVPNGNDNKINALNALIRQFHLADDFIGRSPYFDISNTRNLFVASKKDVYGKIYEIMQRINRALDFLNNMQSISAMLTADCFSKQVIEIQEICEAITRNLANSLLLVNARFSEILTLTTNTGTISSEFFSRAKRIQKELCDDTSGMRLAARLNVQLPQSAFEDFESRYNKSARADLRNGLGL